MKTPAIILIVVGIAIVNLGRVRVFRHAIKFWMWVPSMP